MPSNGTATKEDLAQTANEAATPDFDYVPPREARIKTLVNQAASHAILRERFLPQVTAAKMQGHSEYERLNRDAQFHKLSIGRIWLEVKTLGMTEDAFRAALDNEIGLMMPKS